MKFNHEKLNHLANELRQQIGPFCSAIHATIALHDGVYFRLSAMNQDEAEQESADEIRPQDNCLADEQSPHHLSQDLIDEAILEADQAWRADGKTGPYSRHLARALVQRMTGRECLSQGERTTVDRAADLLEHYASFINEVKPDDIERHPYVPELETTAESLRELLTAQAKPQGEKSKGGE